jgi:formate dehydrogenase subunit delta
MQGNKLVVMVNQIAEFHRREPMAQAAENVARHLERYWERRMRRAIYAHLEGGGEGLSDIGRAAVTLMRDRDAALADGPAELSA